MKIVVGMDEVGRGAWAGPIVVGAVALDISKPRPWKGDSKMLAPATREKISAWIYQNAQFSDLGWASPVEIDEFGLSAALYLAYKRAIRNFDSGCDIIIDGNINYLRDQPRARCIIKADKTMPDVSAASIIAKVARDRYMRELSRKYPAYGFDSHVGYGTQRHIASLSKYGPSVEHRKSYKPIADLI